VRACVGESVTNFELEQATRGNGILTDAEKNLFGFGAQPLVCDAIKKYFWF
jgi:hypothetical protein